MNIFFHSMVKIIAVIFRPQSGIDFTDDHVAEPVEARMIAPILTIFDF